MAANLKNLLGSARAEADKLLAGTFIETPEYVALTQTDDFNFVVGRRGAGKSAIFLHLTEHLRSKSALLHPIEVSDEGARDLYAEIRKLGLSYDLNARISRQLWRAHCLHEALIRLSNHYKAKRIVNELPEHFARAEMLKSLSPVAQCLRMLQSVSPQSAAATPSALISFYGLDALEQAVAECMAEHSIKLTVLVDRLDEGWIPDQIATAIVGGLGGAATSFVDHKCPIHVVLFIRDNIFRALAHLEKDFSRTFEGSALRLRWDESALMRFVARRLELVLHVPQQENEARTWNHFAADSLKGREGFRRCLQLTLYRPRDVIVLLNAAYGNASRNGRDMIVYEDIAASAGEISDNRLGDLVKEYDGVFPSVGILVGLLEGGAVRFKYAQLLARLRDGLDSHDYKEAKSADFSLLATPEDAFDALYGVGLVGVQREDGSAFSFCHDGVPAKFERADDSRWIAVHPAYWRALALTGMDDLDFGAVEVTDEYHEVHATDTVRDVRSRQLGKMLSRLSEVAEGDDGSEDFEVWVRDAIRFLFAGDLKNIELKPNKNAHNRRDIVATVDSSKGFWKRIVVDYHTRQLVVEVKNYGDPTPEDVRQVLDYLSGKYGSFGVIVARRVDDALGRQVRERIKQAFKEHGKVVLVISSALLERCVKKLRSPKRRDYADAQLAKLLDQIERY